MYLRAAASTSSRVTVSTAKSWHEAPSKVLASMQSTSVSFSWAFFTALERDTVPQAGELPAVDIGLHLVDDVEDLFLRPFGILAA